MQQHNDDESTSEEDEKELTFEQRLKKLQRQQAKKKRQQHIQKTKEQREERKKEAIAQKQQQQSEEDGVKKKKNKNAPRELSSKMQVKKIPNVTKAYQKNKQQSRDPRFNDFDGPIEESMKNSLEKKYGFVRDMQQKEIERYKEQLHDSDLDPEAKKNIQRTMSRIVTKLKNKEHEDIVEQVKHDYYESEKKKVAETGKKPFFLKDSKLKELVNKRKREELSGGKLDAYMKKKRKKAKTQHTNLMPTVRRSTTANK
jgi:ribosomal RNA-processing protein 36